MKVPLLRGRNLMRGETHAVVVSESLARGVWPGQDPVGQKLRDAESSALAVSVLGSIADLLACLGIVGVVAYAVSQRTREIGIRMALGARPSHILSVVLRQFSRSVVAGLLVGVAGAAALSGLLRGQLYGISNLDPMAYLGAIGVFANAVE